MLGPVVRVWEHVGSKSKSREGRLMVSRYGQIGVGLELDCFDMFDVTMICQLWLNVYDVVGQQCSYF